jgi:gliding motility-associated-like protein
MQKHIYIFFLLLFTFHQSYSQQNNRWYFGKRAALNFMQNPPAVITTSAMDANEGSASICNTAGDLLFYTNGVTVYNRDNQPMLNGTGLLGNISTVQSAIIVPTPGNPDFYYIFTADALERDFVNGYNYSVVDMTRDGGKGEVVTRNVPLISPGTERMTAARHADGTSVWVITNDRNSNTFRSWLVGCSGISLTPVVSHVGAVLDDYPLQNVGMMKVSPDGKQLCQTHFPIFDEELSNPNFFQLFDFDNVTGVISNARTVNFGDAQVTGCEYSPNSRLLYLARPYDEKIDQVEATLATPASIVASRYTISTAGDRFFGIQMAPDQKIYLSQPSSWLGAINYPDVRGAGCTYREQQIDVGGGIGLSGYIGLPAFINDLSFDGSNGFTYTILDSCTGLVQFNGFSTVPGTLSWEWDFGDGGTSTQQNPVHSFSGANPRYTVKLKIQSAGGCGILERSKEIIPRGLILTAGFDFVGRCDSGYVRFINTSVFAPDTARIQWLWDFGDGNTSDQPNPIHSFSPGSYNVRLTVKTTTACLDQVVMQPINFESVDVHAPADQEIDAGASITLTTTGNGTTFIWTPPMGLSSTAIANPVARPTSTTTYIVTAFNNAGCEASDTVVIKVKRAPGVYVPTGFTPNNDGRNDVMRPLLSDEFDLVEFTIYNRWGEKIFTTSQENVGWNGKINNITQDSGVYVWTVHAIDTRTNTKLEKKGTFVILR